MPKSILILSNKSSGSSALQRLLAQSVNLNCLEKTRHFENESLYWTKAASLLGLPQQDMLDSEVPIPQGAAKHDLIQLLTDNLPGRTLPQDLKGDDAIGGVDPTHAQARNSWVFEGWQCLCEHYGPVFLEKSPHHLLQWSSLSLIVECMAQLEGQVDFLLIGLVRNPMDTMYSAFRRWKTPPEKLQYEWLTAYTNLHQLAKQLGEYTGAGSTGRVVIVRYEDLVNSLDPLTPVFNFCGVQPGDNARTLNRQSLLKWQQDRYFGFSLAPEVVALAQSYGYTPDELTNVSWRFWPLYRDVSRKLYQSLRWLKELYLRLFKIGR